MAAAFLLPLAGGRSAPGHAIARMPRVVSGHPGEGFVSDR